MKIRKLRATMIAAGILGLVIFGLVVAIINQQVTLSRLSADISQQKQSLGRMTKETAAYKTLSAKYLDMSAKLGGRYRSVSWGTQMPSMVNQLTGIMQAQKVKIQTLRPEPITSTDGVSRMPLRISFNAGLGDLAKLVHDMETAVPHLEVERLDIHIADDKSEKLQTDMTVSSFAVTDENAPVLASHILTEKKPDKPAVKSGPAKKPVKVSRTAGGAR